MSPLESQLLKDLSLSHDYLVRLLRDSRRAKKFTIRKRNGGNREIFHPSRPLKMIQYWLLESYFDRLPIHEIATAFRPRTSPKANAEIHKDNTYFLRIDIENFFPSIKKNDLKSLILKNEATMKFKIEDSDWDLIVQACFLADGSLPVGYPSSPQIANASVYEMDCALHGISKEFESTNLVVTRYADDIIFSTREKGICQEVLKRVQALINEIDSPKLRINKNKIAFSSVERGNVSVTGLRITKGGGTQATGKYRDKIRLLLSLYKKKKLKAEDVESLRGHLSYLNDVDPKYLTKLAQKYYQEIGFLLGKI